MIPEGRYYDIGDGLRIHAHERGAGDRAVVFVHGSGPGASGYSNFAENLEYFAARGYRALAPDSLGYGLSSKPTDANYTLAYFNDGLRRYLDAAEVERCTLVGNSMGGAMCVRFALDHPDRVDKLILMAPGGMEPRERYMEMRGIRRMLKAVFSGELTLDSMRRVFELQVYDPSTAPDAVIADRVEMARLQPLRVFETMAVPNLEDQIAGLACPILVFWGQNDEFCPVSGATKFAERCKDTRVVTFTECGHWVMVERPAAFNRLSCDFLDGEL